MLRVMIVEDEKPILDLMRRLADRHPLLEVAGAYTDPLEALDRFVALRPDAVFLDVEMPRMNGMELARRLAEIDEELQVVFTTAYPGYAVEAFRVSAVDYLLKPVTPEAIEAAVSRLSKNRLMRSALRPPASEDDPPVRCLGTFETRSGRDGKLVGWPTRKTEELFAYLLTHPDRLVGKWQLADLLWPELEEDRALHNVHNTVYRLKKSLKEAGLAVELTNTNEGYHFADVPSLSDWGLLRGFMNGTSAIDERNAAEAEKLFRRCRGPLFGGKDYVWSAGLEAEAAALQASLALLLAAYYRRSKDVQAAKETLRAWLGRSPLDEEANAALLELYAELGDASAFRGHYETYVRLLAEELGVGPAKELRALAERTLGRNL